MTTPCCPVCRGETHEIRAKLVCRQCGMILETCCEGGPMAAPDCPRSPAPPAQPAPADDPGVG